MSTTHKEIRRAVLYWLARRDYSQKALFRKLQNKLFSPVDIHSALKDFTEEGLISEARFTESFIRAKRNKGYGPCWIKAALQDQGIDEELIEHHLNIADNDWFCNAQKVWGKRFKYQKPTDRKSHFAQMRFLHYRGFTREHIDRIFQSDD